MYFPHLYILIISVHSIVSYLLDYKERIKPMREAIAQEISKKRYNIKSPHGYGNIKHKKAVSKN